MNKEKIEQAKNKAAVKAGYPNWLEMENWIIDHNKPEGVAQILVGVMEEAMQECASEVNSKRWATELQRRQQLIKSEPDGLVRETMIDNLLLDFPLASTIQQQGMDASQSKQSGGWVKAKERLPEKDGKYFCKVDIPGPLEDVTIGLFENGAFDQTWENFEFPEGSSIWEWYDESAPSINETLPEGKLYERGSALLAKQKELDLLSIENSKLLEALRELVELKEMKDKLSEQIIIDQELLANYQTRKPLAWQAAREIIKSIK